MGNVSKFTQTGAAAKLQDVAKTLDPTSATVLKDLASVETTLTGDAADKSISTGSSTVTPPVVADPTNYINANQGSVNSDPTSFNAANGVNQYIIHLGAGNQLISGANIAITGFGSDDKLVFGATNGTSLNGLESLYGISDDGTNITIIGNDAGTVQQIKLVSPTGLPRTGAYTQIDTLTELNSFLGGGNVVVDSSYGDNSAVGNGTIATPSTKQTSGNDVLNATLGSVTGAAITYNASAGNDQYIINLGSGNTIVSGTNVSISGFTAGDKLVFDLDGVNYSVVTTAITSQLNTLNGIYSISDNGVDVSIIANNAGTVQQITLVGVHGTSNNSIDDLSELNTLLGGSAITVI
jgi:hypothetical protein